MPSTDQNGIPAAFNMDARKFLRAINSSAQSRIVFFEDVIKKIGKEAKKDYRLVALESTSLIFEDTGGNSYYHADINRKGRNRIEVSNIRPINIVEDEKPQSFDKHCRSLVESLSSDDFRGAEQIFRTIEVQRFRPSVIPEDGWVTTRDGNAHHIKIDDAEDKFDIPAIVESFTKAVSDFVDVDETGKVIRGVFPEGNINIEIPINEMTKRRLVAGHMKSVAEDAWQSDTFKKLVRNVAGMVSKNNLKEAIQTVAKFIKEEQEFSMLTSDECLILVENALASTGEFNSILSEDVATLFHRVNARVNKNDIIDAWTKTAIKAENAELLHGVKLLESSNDFPNDYDAFLNRTLIESQPVQKAKIDAYRTSLMMIESILSKMENNQALAEQIRTMIDRLSQPDPDTNVMSETEKLFAAIPPRIVETISTLDNFKAEPGIMEEPAPAPEPKGSAKPIGGAPSGGGGGGPKPGLPKPPGGELPPMPEEGEEGEEEAGKPGEKPGEKPGAPPLPESVDRSKFPLVEEMNHRQLTNELDSWKTEGHIFLEEDGFEDCNDQFARFIKRCEEIGADNLKKEFESLRETMIKTGNDVIDEELIEDPYAGLDVGSKVDINEEYGAASMEPPKGSGLAAKSGSEPGYAGKGKAAGGDPKMDSPKGKGLAERTPGEADFSGSGSQEIEKQTGKGLAGKGLTATPDLKPNKGVELEKPKTGGAQMDRPKGKGVAESVGKPEDVPPITSANQNPNAGPSTKDGKQLKGKWLQSLEAALATELKSGDQGSKTTSATPGIKGGVAGSKGGVKTEGEMPEALKKHQFQSKGKEAKETKCEKCNNDKCECEKDGKLSENKIRMLNILQPYMPRFEKFNKSVVEEAVDNLREAAKSDPTLNESLKVVGEALDDYYQDPTEPLYDPSSGKFMEKQFEPEVRRPARTRGIEQSELVCDTCGTDQIGIAGDQCPDPECGGTLESLKDPLSTTSPGDESLSEYQCDMCGKVMPGQEGEPCHDRDCQGILGIVGGDEAGELEEVEGLEESQYKNPTKAIKPTGFKRTAINEKGEKKNKDEISEGVLAVYATDKESIDQAINAIVGAMEGSGGELAPVLGAPDLSAPPEVPELEGPAGEAGLEIPGEEPEELPEAPPETPEVPPETPEAPPETPEAPPEEKPKPAAIAGGAGKGGAEEPKSEKKPEKKSDKKSDKKPKKEDK